MARTARWLGWILLIGGAVVLLYVVYLLWFTGLETERAQSQLAESFPGMAVMIPDTTGTPERARAARHPTDPDDPVVVGPEDDGAPEPTASEAEDEAVDPAEAYAALWFERDGNQILHDEVLFVVEGVTIERLRSGPGHYPDSDPPGGGGNVAVAGHRTTYGSPFWSVNELRDGDTIHLMDRDGVEWVYAYREQRTVDPTSTWVVGDDPLGTGEPMITLTTCHPRGSAAQRLVVFGELTGEPRREAAT